MAMHLLIRLYTRVYSTLGKVAEAAAQEDSW